MKIVLDIPEKDIPKRQEIVTIDLYFIDGTVCAASYPCEELPKGHGRLIDADVVKEGIGNLDGFGMLGRCIDEMPTVIDADRGDAE